MVSGTNYILDESSKSHEIAEHFGPVCKDREFRSWYDYIEAFKELEAEKNGIKPKYPSPKVSAMLDRMRQLDRNPLMHPRDSLDEMSADTLFKLGIVTITELAKDMRDMTGQPELKLIANTETTAS